MSAELIPPSGWAGPTAPRIAATRSPPFTLLARVSNRLLGRPEPPNIMLTLHRNPGLFWPWLWFASRFMPWGSLDPRDRERVILRVAWNCRCRYEWGQHVDLAARAGLDAAELERIIEGPDAGWPTFQRALLRACDELHGRRCIADDTWEALAGHYSEAQLIELCLLIGHYEMVAGFLNSAGVRLEALR